MSSRPIISDIGCHTVRIHTAIYFDILNFSHRSIGSFRFLIPGAKQLAGLYRYVIHTILGTAFHSINKLTFRSGCLVH